MTVRDPLTDREKQLLHQVEPSLSRNPPGIDLPDVLARFADTIQLTIDEVAILAVAERLLQQGQSEQQIKDGLLRHVFASAADLPAYASLTFFPQYAIVENGEDFPLLFWAQMGGDSWQASEWPYMAPPDPLGTWLLNAENNSLGAGNNGSSYWMGIRFRTKASGVNKVIKRIAFKGGATAATPRNWEVRKSTASTPGFPPFNTYTDILQTGTVTVDGATWEIDLIPEIPMPAADEHYMVWWQAGPGWQSQNVTGLSMTDLNESFVELGGGVFLFGSTPTPGTPTGGSSSTAYGLASAAHGDPS